MITSLQTVKTVLPTNQRRAFLRQSALACLSAGWIGSTAETLAFTNSRLASTDEIPSNKAAVKQLSRTTFEPHLSEYFEATDASGTSVMLLLLDIAEVQVCYDPQRKKALPEDWRERSFALTFRGPVAKAMRQGICRLKYPGLGELSFFLAPVGRVADDAAWRDYEAVFNRLVE